MNTSSKEKFEEKIKKDFIKKERKNRRRSTFGKKKKNNDTDLTIYPLKDEDYVNEERYKDLPDVLPRPNFRLLFSAYSGFGKDVIISNLLLRSNFLDITNKEKPYIDYFVLVSPTCHNDPSQAELREWADDVYTEFDPQIIDDLVALQDEKRDEYEDEDDEDDEPFQILLYINDLLGDKNLARSIDKFIVRARHSNINLIISYQSLKHRTCSPIVRSNLTHLVVSKVMCEKQLESLTEEYDGMYEGHFKELYNMATKGRYDFLFLDLKNRKAYNKFDTLLYQAYDDEDENQIGANANKIKTDDILNDE